MEAVDIYWEQGIKPDIIEDVFMFNENEHGHAGYIAMKGMVGDATPTGRVVSHLISNVVFNQTKHPHEVGWEIYTIGKTAFVNINEWPSTPLYPLEESKNTWIYIYPAIRDLLLKLQDLGATNLHYCSSLAVHEVLDPNDFAPQDEESIFTYDFSNNTSSDSEVDFFFSPPTWLFPYFAHKMGWETTKAILCGYEPDEVINRKAGASMAQFLHKEHGHEVFVDSMTQAQDEMFRHSERAESIQKEMEELIKERPTNNTMWG